jgi:dihydroxy-acid dehydratase
LAEALGLTLPETATLPAVDSRRLALAEAAGRRAVEIAGSDLTPLRILTRSAFENAALVNAAIGGSTNAILHLLAIAGRASVDFTLEDFDRIGLEVPLLVDLKPSGRFLMEEFSDAGGMPALMSNLKGVIEGDLITVTGETISANYSNARVWNNEVIRSIDHPVMPAGSGTVVVRGTLAPDGAVMKISAAAPELLSHEGRAVVFDSIDEYMSVVDDLDLDVAPDDILVVRNVGPIGYPGMPEVGNLPIPARLLRQGVTDMVRISDARMSGTAFGACILHVSPEAAVGGPLAFVRTGDRIQLDAHQRVLNLLVEDSELAERMEGWTQEITGTERGWTGLYRRHVTQAHLGADLDFLVGSTESSKTRKAF